MVRLPRLPGRRTSRRSGADARPDPAGPDAGGPDPAGRGQHRRVRLGALAAVEFAAPPAYLAAPVQLAAETLAVAGAAVNRRATRGLGDKVVAELRGRHPTALPG